MVTRPGAEMVDCAFCGGAHVIRTKLDKKPKDYCCYKNPHCDFCDGTGKTWWDICKYCDRSGKVPRQEQVACHCRQVTPPVKK